MNPQEILYSTLTLDPLVIVSRIIMILAWGWASLHMWKVRDLPHANTALAGSLAMTIAHAAMLFDSAIPYSILLFFMAMAQVTVVVSFIRLTDSLKDIRRALTTRVGKWHAFSMIMAGFSTLFLRMT